MGVRITDELVITARWRDAGVAQGSNQMQTDLRRTETAVNNVTGSLTRMAGMLGVVLGTRELIRYADTWTQVDNRIRLYTDNARETLRVQQDLFRVAQATRAPMAETVELYQRMAQNSDQLGLSQERLARVTELINKTLLISSTSPESSRAALIQLGQAMASGVLRGEEFNSMMEQAPRLARALADGLGVPIGQLRKMAEAGELTAQRVIGALESQGGVIDREADKMVSTIGQSLTRLENSLGRYLHQGDQAIGVTSTLAGGINTLADRVDTAAIAVVGLAGALAVLRVPAWLESLVLLSRGGAGGAAGVLGGAALATGSAYGLEKYLDWTNISPEMRRHLERGAYGAAAAGAAGAALGAPTGIGAPVLGAAGLVAGFGGGVATSMWNEYDIARYLADPGYFRQRTSGERDRFGQYQEQAAAGQPFTFAPAAPAWWEAKPASLFGDQTADPEWDNLLAKQKWQEQYDATLKSVQRARRQQEAAQRAKSFRFSPIDTSADSRAEEAQIQLDDDLFQRRQDLRRQQANLEIEQARQSGDERLAIQLQWQEEDRQIRVRHSEWLLHNQVSATDEQKQAATDATAEEQRLAAARRDGALAAVDGVKRFNEENRKRQETITLLSQSAFALSGLSPKLDGLTSTAIGMYESLTKLNAQGERAPDWFGAATLAVHGLLVAIGKSETETQRLQRTMERSADATRRTADAVERFRTNVEEMNREELRGQVDATGMLSGLLISLTGRAGELERLIGGKVNRGSYGDRLDKVGSGDPNEILFYLFGNSNAEGFQDAFMEAAAQMLGLTKEQLAGKRQGILSAFPGLDLTQYQDYQAAQDIGGRASAQLGSFGTVLTDTFDGAMALFRHLQQVIQPQTVAETMDLLQQAFKEVGTFDFGQEDIQKAFKPVVDASGTSVVDITSRQYMDLEETLADLRMEAARDAYDRLARFYEDAENRKIADQFAGQHLQLRIQAQRELLQAGADPFAQAEVFRRLVASSETLMQAEIAAKRLAQETREQNGLPAGWDGAGVVGGGSAGGGGAGKVVADTGAGGQTAGGVVVDAGAVTFSPIQKYWTDVVSLLPANSKDQLDVTRWDQALRLVGGGEGNLSPYQKYWTEVVRIYQANVFDQLGWERWEQALRIPGSNLTPYQKYWTARNGEGVVSILRANTHDQLGWESWDDALRIPGGNLAQISKYWTDVIAILQANTHDQLGWDRWDQALRIPGGNLGRIPMYWTDVVGILQANAHDQLGWDNWEQALRIPGGNLTPYRKFWTDLSNRGVVDIYQANTKDQLGWTSWEQALAIPGGNLTPYRKYWANLNNQGVVDVYQANSHDQLGWDRWEQALRIPGGNLTPYQKYWTEVVSILQANTHDQLGWDSWGQALRIPNGNLDPMYFFLVANNSKSYPGIGRVLQANTYDQLGITDWSQALRIVGGNLNPIEKSWADIIALRQLVISSWSQVVQWGGGSSGTGYPAPGSVPISAVLNITGKLGLRDLVDLTAISTPASGVLRITSKIGLGDLVDLGQLNSLVNAQIESLIRQRYLVIENGKIVLRA